MLVPAKNEADVAELEEEITKGLTVLFVSDMEEVLSEALAK